MSDFVTLSEVAEFEKGAERVKARVVQSDDRRFLDIRAYYADKTGEWRPSRRGLAIPEELGPELFATVEQLVKEADSLRLAGK